MDINLQTLLLVMLGISYFLGYTQIRDLGSRELRWNETYLTIVNSILLFVAVFGVEYWIESTPTIEWQFVRLVVGLMLLYAVAIVNVYVSSTQKPRLSL